MDCTNWVEEKEWVPWVLAVALRDLDLQQVAYRQMRYRDCTCPCLRMGIHPAAVWHGVVPAEHVSTWQ